MHHLKEASVDQVSIIGLDIASLFFRRMGRMPRAVSCFVKDRPGQAVGVFRFAAAEFGCDGENCQLNCVRFC